jgi:hypothetical protein
MIKGDVLLAFKGDITSDILSNTLNIIECKLDRLSVKSSVKKRIYHVLVESLQNLYHHVDQPRNIEGISENERFGCYMLSMLENKVLISTANFVQKDKKRDLENRIREINSATKEELKLKYKEILNNQSFSEKGGGGLGLMDIARKTGNKLDYDFSSVNDDYYFFRLDVFVNKELNT